MTVKIRLPLAVFIAALSAFSCAQAAAPPELVVQHGNSSGIDALALDSKDRLLASASSDGVFLWDVSSGRMLRRMSSRGARTAGFSGDGKYVLDGRRLYDLRTGRVLAELKASGECTGSFSRSPDGRRLAAVTQSADRSLQVTIWDIHSPGFSRQTFALHPLTRLVDMNTYPCPTVFSADGARFYSDLPIVERDVATGRVLRTISGDYDRVFGFSPDGKSAVTGSTSSKTSELPFELRALADGHVIRALHLRPETSHASFSSDGKHFAVTYYNGGSVYDVATGKERPYQYSGRPAEGFVLNRDGSRLIGGTQGGDLFVADLASGRAREFWTGHAVSNLDLSPNRQWLVTANGGNSVVWDLTTGQPAIVMPKSCDSLAFSSDSRRLGCWAKGAVEIWETTSWTVARTFDLTPLKSPENFNAFYPNGWPPDVFFLADNATFVVAQDSPNGFGAKAIAVLHLDTGAIDGPLTVKGARASPASAAHGSAIDWLEADGSIREYTASSKMTRLVANVPVPGYHRGEVSWVVPSFGGVAPGGRYAIVADGPKLPVYDLSLGAKPVGEIRLGDFHSPASFLGFSNDGTLAGFAEADADGRSSTFVLASIPSGRIVGRFAGHTASLEKFALSPDKTLLITCAGDGTVRLWNVARGRQVATLFAGASDPNEWLVSAPNGAFDGSPRGWSAMLWRFKGDTFDVAPPETFFNDFYDPGLLADAVAGRAPPNRSLGNVDRRSPTIDAVTVLGRPPYSRHVRVRVQVRSNGAGAFDVRLTRNGTEVMLWKGDVLHGARQATLETSATLVAGSNEFFAYAFNRANVRSAIVAVSVSGAKTLERKGVAHILAIGVNLYSNKDFALRYAGPDARAFADEAEVKAKALGTYSGIDVVRLFDKAVTKSSIVTALAGIAHRAQPEDTVFIYFAGHGVARDERYYLLPHDVGYTGLKKDIDDAALDTITAHSISDRDIAEALLPLDARQIVLIIDACESGEALGDRKQAGPMNAKGLAQVAYDKGMYVLAASQGNQAALEAQKYGHGLLTYALVVQGLHAGEAVPKDGAGVLLLRPWLTFAQGSVPKLQRGLIETAQAKGVTLSFVDGAARNVRPSDRALQRPRIYYPSRVNDSDLIVARFR